MTLPEIIPLFPLPNVVFFPYMPLPLHVFEPRYRAMVQAAAGGARLIGMVLLRGDWQAEYYGRPPLFATGTVGEMVRVEELPDGRFNIVLRGLREFVIVREVDRGTSYREALVQWRTPSGVGLPGGMREALTDLVRRYLARLGRETNEESLLGGAVDDETFVNVLAQHLDLAPLEKQALLEAPTVPLRAHRLRDVLEFGIEALRVHAGGPSGRAH